MIFLKDDKKTRDRQRISNGSVLEFRRRHSSLDTSSQTSPSIILRPTIFRTNFRPTAVQVRDYTKTSRKKNFD